jgi:hypothetical protein
MQENKGRKRIKEGREYRNEVNKGRKRIKSRNPKTSFLKDKIDGQKASSLYNSPFLPYL